MGRRDRRGGRASTCGSEAPSPASSWRSTERTSPTQASDDVVARREVARIVHDLGERRTSRHRRDVERAREARADADDQVGLLEELIDRSGPGARRRAEGERMILRERALAVQRRRDRRRGPFGELQQLVARVRVEHALARHDDGTGCSAQRVQQLLDVAPVGVAEMSPQRRDVPVGVAGVAVQHVVRDRQQHRAVAHAMQRVERLAEEPRPVRGVAQRCREARDRTVRLLAADAYRRVHDVVRVLARQQQDRAAIAVRLRDGAVGRLGTGPVLRHAGGDPLAVGRTRVPVRDVDRHPLGARDDRAYPEQ